jgi:hypothetical protein
MRRGSENLERLIGAESDQSQAEPLPSILPSITAERIKRIF